MSVLLPVALFALGTVVASFVGVLVARLNTGQSFMAGRSRCDACGAPLAPFALVPIFSYLALKGRARCCSARLPLLAPAVELLLGGLFAGAYGVVGPVSALPFMLASLSLLLALVLYDLNHHILPSALLGAFIVASAVTGFFLAQSFAGFVLLSLVAFLLALPLALIHLFSRGRLMGLSDAPLTFGLALLVGPAALPGFVFSFWIGAVVGLLILAWRPRGSRMRVEVPFAPYLAAGFLLAYFTQWNPFTFVAVLSGR